MAWVVILAAGLWVLSCLAPGADEGGQRIFPGSARDKNAVNIAVADVHGVLHRPLLPDDRKATVFFFLLHDCPISNTYAPEINRIVSAYSTKGVRAYVVYVEGDLSARQAGKHARDYGFQCPALLDPSHQLVNYTRVTVVPEAAVLSPGGELLYRGRIDDRVSDFGKRRVEPTQRDLRQALDAILENKPVPVPTTKAIGCYIPSAKEPKRHEN